MDLLAQPSDLESLGEEGLPEAQARFLLQSATDLVRRACGWQISSVTETLTVDGTGGSLLFLPTLHLRDVTGVRVDGSPVTIPAWSTDGVLEGGFPRGRRNIAVDALHGYVSVPQDVALLVARLALRAHLNPADALSESFAGGSASWGPADWSILARYKIPGAS